MGARKTEAPEKRAHTEKGARRTREERREREKE